MERRLNKRYAVDAPADFDWIDASGFRKQSSGRIRNCCATGLFIESPQPPPLTTNVSIRFKLRPEGNAPCVSVNTKGRVNRVESGLKKGFSVQTGKMKLKKLPFLIRGLQQRVGPAGPPSHTRTPKQN